MQISLSTFSSYGKKLWSSKWGRIAIFSSTALGCYFTYRQVKNLSSRKSEHTKKFKKISIKTEEQSSPQNETSKNVSKRESKSLFSFISSKMSPKPLHKNIKEVENLLKEFLSTEEIYVNDLKNLKEYYIDKLVNFATQKKEQRRSMKSKTVHPKLFPFFAQVDIIFSINTIFLEKLNSVISKDVKNNHLKLNEFSKIIVDFAHSFKLYSDYISKYQKYQKIIYEEKKNNIKFSKFLLKINDILKGKGLRNTAFLSLLITPIQRIPRYQLLLSGILKNTRDDSIEYKKLTSAFNLVVVVANFCNTKTKEMNDFEKTKELMASLQLKKQYNHLMKTMKRILKAGNVIRITKKGKRVNSKMIMFSRVIILRPIKRILDGTLFKQDYVIPLVNSKLEYDRVDNDMLLVSFSVNLHNKKFVYAQKRKRVFIRFPSKEECEDWMQSLSTIKEK